MRTILKYLNIAAVATLALSQAVLAQRVGTARLPEDLVSIRQLADKGNVQAQLEFARRLLAKNECAEALSWYRKTADQNCWDGVYQVGNLLLFGARSSVAGEDVPANPTEGVTWTYRAATNGYAGAYRSMSLALQGGLGVRTNLAEAYAWMSLFAEAQPQTGREELEALGLHFPTDILVEGRRLAGEFRKRNWPKLKIVGVAVVARFQVALKLTGVAVGGRSPLAVINTRTFGPGESGKVPIGGGNFVNVKCLEIKEDCAQVEVEGEDDTRWLPFENSSGSVAGK